MGEGRYGWPRTSETIDRPANNRNDEDMSKATARATTRPAKPEGKVRVTQPERTAEFAALFGDPQIAMEEMRQFS